MCISNYAGHFYIRNWGYLFDFTSTHAILTPVISIFWSVFYSKSFFPCRPLWRNQYQKTWNFIPHLLSYMKSLSGYVHLCAHLRKSLKMDFPCFVPRKWVRVWYRFQWFLKLYNLSYWASSFIRWIQKSWKSRNSTYLWLNCSYLDIVISPPASRKGKSLLFAPSVRRSLIFSL